jgi:hypothetical protein
MLRTSCNATTGTSLIPRILTSGGYSAMGEGSFFSIRIEGGAVRILEKERSSMKLMSASVGLAGLPALIRRLLNREEEAMDESFSVRGLAVRRLRDIFEGTKRSAAIEVRFVVVRIIGLVSGDLAIGVMLSDKEGVDEGFVESISNLFSNLTSEKESGFFDV